MTRRQGDKVNKAGGLRYVGGGAFLPHVPARDLSVAEVEIYAAWLRDAEEAGTLALLYETMPSTSSGDGEGIVGGVSEGKGEVVNG